MKRVIALAVLLGLFALPALALQIEGALSPVQPADVERHGDFALRKVHPNAYLSDKGDFDGDGKMDEVAFYKNSKGQVVVLIRLVGDTGMILPNQLLSLKSDMPRAGVKTVKPGTYKTACSKGAGPDDQPCKPEVTTTTDAFEVFTFEAGSTLYVWKDTEFEAYPFSD